MNFKATLIGGVALSAMVSLGMAGGVQAKTSGRHHHPARGPSSSEVELHSQVRDLQSEVKALEGRLDAQAQAQEQTQSQIQAAQSQAQTAQATAQAAQTQVAAQQSQIETIPTEIRTESARSAPKPGWWNNTTLGATMFADGSYISNKNDGVKNSQSDANYDIKRAYLSVDHRFNDIFAANFTTDFTYDSTTKATQLYIKKAYLQAHLNDALTIRAGSADLPWVPFVEGIYGYRYVDHVLIDNYSFGTSADWGVHFLGTVLDKHIGYALSVVDGNGYKIAPTGTANRTDYLDVEGRVNVNYDHFTVAVGGYDGKLGKAITGGAPTFHTAERFDAIAAYTDSHFRVGAEYMWAKYFGDVLQADPTKTNTAEGVSAFVSWQFMPKFSIFGRYDYLKPKENTQPSFHNDFYNIGVAYKPIGPLDIALVYKHDSVLNGLLSTGNGTIGTLNAHNIGKGEYDEVGVFTQVKF